MDGGEMNVQQREATPSPDPELSHNKTQVSQRK